MPLQSIAVRQSTQGSSMRSITPNKVKPILNELFKDIRTSFGTGIKQYYGGASTSSVRSSSKSKQGSISIKLKDLVKDIKPLRTERSNERRSVTPDNHLNRSPYRGRELIPSPLSRIL